MQIQAFPINFAGGLDTKTDPKQVQAGKFLLLQNTIFDKGGLLQKRNGFGQLATLPNPASYVTTLNDNLTAIGRDIQALSSSTNQWVTKGNIQPLSVSTLPLIRNNLNQNQVDSAVAPNGLVCTVYNEFSGFVTTVKYAIANSVTGQNITAPIQIPVTTGTPTGGARVFVVGNYFVIVFTNLITSTYHLQYIAISTMNPTNVTINQDIADSYIPSSALSWDAVSVNNSLYIAYNTVTGGQRIIVTYLSATQITGGLVPAAPMSYPGYTATIMSVAADISNAGNPKIYVSFYNSGSSTGYTLIVDKNTFPVLAPTETITIAGVVNITQVSNAQISNIYYEVSNAYGYDSSIPTNYINSVSITQSGTVGSTYTMIRSVGLASKAVLVDSINYVLVAYQSPYQPTYFMINASQSIETMPIIVGKLAYENGGGYLTTGLPNITVTDDQILQVAYLYKDLIESVNNGAYNNEGTSPVWVPPAAGAQVNGIYSQTGINLATFTLGAGIFTSETAGCLHLSGGFLGMYDGYLPVEHNFFLYPDSVEATYNANSTVTPTGSFLTGSFQITLSSTTGVYVGMTVADTTNPSYIQAGTIIRFIEGDVITISLPTLGTSGTDTLSIQGNIAAQPTSAAVNTNVYFTQWLYEWTDNQGNAYRSAPSIAIPISTTGSGTNGTITYNVPTLRLTAKTSNPVKITGYRWSTGQQAFYQITSIIQPVQNDLTVDYITFVDTLSDAAILGDNLIYTTGGVVEDVNAPATNIMTLFDTRLWLVDAEDQNLLWYSKQVIENVPVEMSDLLTYYVPPATAAQGTTGPITALAPMDSNLIIFKENAIYYLNGAGPDNTGANNQYSQPIFITATVGCSNPYSIVFTPNGLMFQSNHGIWLLGRDLSTTYIGAAVEEFNSSNVQSAVNVPATNQVRFTLDTGQYLMYDYYYEEWGTFVGLPAIASCIYQGLHTVIDSYGRVFQETPGLYLDGSNPVLIAFVTGWLKLSGIAGYQRALEFLITGQYLTPHTLNVQIAYDFQPFSEIAEIEPINYTGLWGSDQLWGQTSPWGGPGVLEQWRVQLATQQCQTFQIGISENFDPSFGTIAGAGFTLSAITAVLGINRTYRPIKAVTSVGTQ